MPPKIHTHVVSCTTASLRIGRVSFHSICTVFAQLSSLSGSATVVSGLAIVKDALMSMATRHGLQFSSPWHLGCCCSSSLTHTECETRGWRWSPSSCHPLLTQVLISSPAVSPQMANSPTRLAYRSFSSVALGHWQRCSDWGSSPHHSLPCLWFNWHLCGLQLQSLIQNFIQCTATANEELLLHLLILYPGGKYLGCNTRAGQQGSGGPTAQWWWQTLADLPHSWELASQLVIPETALEHLHNVLVCCSCKNTIQNACCLPLHDGEYVCDFLQGCANVLLYHSLELAMKHDPGHDPIKLSGFTLTALAVAFLPTPPPPPTWTYDFYQLHFEFLLCEAHQHHCCFYV